MYASPVAYPVSLVPEHGALLRPQPDGRRNRRIPLGVAWEGKPGLEVIAVRAAVVLVLLVGGIVYFKRMERTFADVI